MSDADRGPGSADREAIIKPNWVRISDLASTGARAPELLATAMIDLAAAQALVMIHGQERGAARYITAGGRVRMDENGEPVIWVGASQ